MKKIIFLLTLSLVFTFISCGGGSSGGDNTVIVTDPTVPEDGGDPADPVDPTDPDDPESDDNHGLPLAAGTIQIMFSTGGALKFYDGQYITTVSTLPATAAGFQKVCIGDVLYSIDYVGRVTKTENIIGTFDAAEIDDDGNLWQMENISSTDSYNAGAFPANHVKIYKNGVEYGDWKTRQYTGVSLHHVGDIVAYRTNVGGYKHINGDETISKMYDPDGYNQSGVVAIDYDSTNHTATLNGVAVSWSTNFFNMATNWLKSDDGVWYSSNGYTFDGVTLNENGSALTCWRNKSTYPITLSETANVVSVGYRKYNGENVFLYIECNSGYLFQYIPSTDKITIITRLFTGDGLQATGISVAKIIKPVANGHGVIFCYTDGGMYMYKYDTTLTSYLTAGADWVAKWEE